MGEGFQLLHDAEVAPELCHIFLLEIGYQEAKRRRTQKRDRVLNPNPMSVKDFDELVWPAHQRHMARSVAPLVDAGKVTVLPSPNSESEVAQLVRQMAAAVASSGQAL